MSHLFLIRHGQASFLSDNYDQLSENGVKQARVLGESFASQGVIFDSIYSGELVRQFDTTEIVKNVYDERGINFPEIQKQANLNEYPAEEIMTSLGKYLIDNDRNAAELFKKCNSASNESDRHRYFQKLFELILESWVKNDQQEVHLSVTWTDWSNRVRKALKEIMADAKKGELIAVFTSGGPIGVSVQTALEAPDMKAAELNWRVYNCSVTKFTFNETRFTLDHFNDVSYLTSDLLTYR